MPKAKPSDIEAASILQIETIEILQKRITSLETALASTKKTLEVAKKDILLLEKQLAAALDHVHEWVDKVQSAPKRLVKSAKKLLGL